MNILTEPILNDFVKILKDEIVAMGGFGMGAAALAALDQQPQAVIAQNQIDQWENLITQDDVLGYNTEPSMLLTISGLPMGKAMFGFSNGVHTISPNYYDAPGAGSEEEEWARYFAVWPNFQVMYMDGGYSSSFGSDVNFARFSNLVPTYSWYWSWFGAGNFMAQEFRTSGATATPLLYNVVPTWPNDSIGAPDLFIRNRQFGTLTTADGVTISWQRANNWPAHP